MWKPTAATGMTMFARFSMPTAKLQALREAFVVKTVCWPLNCTIERFP
jgi:hypothetical protein